MNLQQLKYVVEVEKTKSITAAARNLYMGQPNLSKSIRELENEIGITLFERTARGVVFTKQGTDFLWYAKSILSQVEQLEKMYAPSEKETLSCGVSVPRATYVSVAFSRFASKLPAQSSAVDIRYRETNAISVVNDVAEGASGLGIVRYELAHEEYFMNMIADNHLTQTLLWQYPMLVMIDQNHPLASYSEIPYHALSSYPEIVHGDFYLPILPPESNQEFTEKASGSTIQLYDRGSQFDILKQVSGSYLWVSPMPKEQLALHGLVTRPCSNAGIYKDLLVHQSRKKITEVEQQFIQTVKEQIAELQHGE